MRKSRAWALLLAGMSLGGCRSAGRVSVSEEAAGDDPLRVFLGQQLVLRHFGDRREIEVKPGEARKGSCDVAVRVKDAVAVQGGVRFTLESLGRVQVEGRPAGTCETLASPLRLTLKGVNAARPEEWRTFMGTMLLATDAYLAFHGKTGTYAPEPEPQAFANNSSNTDDEGRRLAQRVTAWPKPLFTIEPFVPSPGGKVRHEGEIAFSAVIGRDGRVYRPRLKTSLEDAHQGQVTSVLTLWRFEPARERELALPALYEGRTVLRMY